MEKVEIFDITYEGSGVGKIGGKVVFVPKTLPGEVVKIEIAKQNSSFSIGKLKNICTLSAKRIKPLCPYFDECGGCDFQQCNEGYEKELKTIILKNELAKVGYKEKIEFVSSNKRYFYRNKLTCEVKENNLGFFKAKSRDFLPIQKCVIANEKINDCLMRVNEFLKINKFKNLKNVYFKEVDETVAICFLFDKKVAKLQKNAKNLQIFDNFSVFFAFGDVLESDKTEIYCVHGNENLTKTFSQIKCQVDVKGFNQVNDYVAEKLYEYICSFVKNKRVVNAYSGQGLLTKLLSKSAKFVYGIEYQKSAHDAACELVTQLNTKNICGKVEEKLSQILLADCIDFIVLDPAREGCKKEVLNAINESKIQTICYVSCNFASLCRDIKILASNYGIKNVKIFDMFPCTSSLETAVILEKI